VTEPSTVECRKESDVVFVVDSTSNLLEKDFQMYILGTIAEITQQLDVDSGRTRVAAVPFTITAKVHGFICYSGPDLSVWRPWAGSLLEASTHSQML